MKRVLLTMLTMLLLLVFIGGSLYIYYKYPIALLFPLLSYLWVYIDVKIPRYRKLINKSKKLKTVIF